MIEFIVFLFATLLISLLMFADGRNNLMMYGFLLHFFISFTLFSTLGFTPDAEIYDDAAKILAATKDFSAFNEALPQGKQLLSLISGFIYSVFGYRPIILMIFLSLLFSFLPRIVRRICLNFEFVASTRIMPWMSILLPQPLIWSSLINREGLSILALIILLMILSYMYKRQQVAIYAFPTLLLITASIYLRPQLLVSIAIGVLITTLIISFNKIHLLKRLNTKTLFEFSFGILLFLFASYAYLMDNQFGLFNVETRDTMIKDLSVGATSASSETSGGSNVGSDGSIRDVDYSLLEFVKIILQNFLPSTFGPGPSKWDSVPNVIVGLDGAFLILIFLILGTALTKSGSIRIASILSLSISLPVLFQLSYIYSNYGLSMRIRDSVLLVLLIPAFEVVLRFKRQSYSE